MIKSKMRINSSIFVCQKKCSGYFPESINANSVPNASLPTDAVVVNSHLSALTLGAAVGEYREYNVECNGTCQPGHALHCHKHYGCHDEEVAVPVGGKGKVLEFE